MLRRATWLERALLVAAGLLLVHSSAWGDWMGAGLLAAVFPWQRFFRRAPA